MRDQPATRLQRDLGYDLIGSSAPTMLMPCSLVPWFQEYEVQLAGTREIIRRKRPQRLSHGRLRRLTGKFNASCGQFFVVFEVNTALWLHGGNIESACLIAGTTR